MECENISPAILRSPCGSQFTCDKCRKGLITQKLYQLTVSVVRGSFHK